MDRISVCLKLKTVGGPFLGTPFGKLTAGIIFGGGLAFDSHSPRCLRMSRITDGSSMLLMIRIAP